MNILRICETNSFVPLAAFLAFSLSTGAQECTTVPSNGPFAGGNQVLVTNTVPAIGSGNDITNVLLGGVNASITDQGTNWVSILVPPMGSAGVKTFVIQSTSVGPTTFAGVYTVNPAGQIGSVSQDWGQWDEVAGLPAPRGYLATAVLNGALYALGGVSDNTGTTQTNMYKFNGTNWTEVAGLPVPRWGFTAAVLNDSLFAFGGGYTNVYRYNGTNWTETQGLPARRSSASCVLDGSLYSIGGYDASSAKANVYRYNGANWTEVASLPSARWRLAASVFNGSMYAIAGNNPGVTNVYRYNGSSWTEVQGLPDGRQNLSAGMLNGSLYAIGGWGFYGRQTNVFRYNGSNWSEAPGLPAVRDCLAASVLNESLYAVGGYSDSGPQTNVYRYPRIAIDPGVTPSNGSFTGGFQVVISGSNLCLGTDITNVTLCGASVASIVRQNPTQVVVTAAAQTPGPGDVIVYSTSFGTTIKSNAFTYLKADQVISFTSIPAQWATNKLGLHASADSSLPVNFTVRSGPATLMDGTNLIFTGAGSVDIIASQSGNAFWNPAPNVTNTFAVTKVLSSVVLQGLNQTYDGTARTISVLTAPTGLVVQVTYNGIPLAPTNAGTYAVTGTVTEALYQGWTNGTLNVTRANQTITFTFLPPQLTTNKLALSASATSGLQIGFAVGSGPATLAGGTNLSFSGTGVVAVIATQIGNGNWNPAPPVTNTFSVSKALASVTLNALSQTYNGTARIVDYSTIPTGLSVVVTYDGNTTPPTNAHTYAVTGTVSDAMYAGVTNASLAVAKADQTITFPTILPRKRNTTLGMSANASSGLPVSFAVSDGPGTITEVTNLLCSAVGDVRIVASQPGDTNYNAATDVSRLVKVYQVVPPTGPFSGGNSVSITNGSLGNGSDITSVLVGGVEVVRTGQGANWVTITIPTNTSPGIKDIVIQSTSRGGTAMLGAYTVNPTGQIIGASIEDWENVKGLPGARYGLAVGALNGSLYAIGGFGAGDQQTNVYRYDGTNWTQVSGLPAPRYGLAAGALNGYLYAFGGYGAGDVQSSSYRFNGTNWTQVASLPAPRDFLAAGVLNGALYAVGGWDGSAAQTNVYRYDGTNWIDVAPLPEARYGLGVATLNGAIYAIGGAGMDGAKTNVYRFDGTNWMEVSGLPVGRDFLSADTLNGALYAIGGSYSTNVYRYTETETSWKEAPGLPAPRSYHAACVLNGLLHAVGGTDGTTTRTNVFRYPRVVGYLPGITPSNGRYAGGFAVTILGTNLGNGSDITNVTLCGVSVSNIVTQSSTQVVVLAGTGAPGAGGVSVYSTSYGPTTKTNVFTYNPTILATAGIHGSVVPNGTIDVAFGSSTSFVVGVDTYYHISSLMTNGANNPTALNLPAFTSTWMNVKSLGTLAAIFAENLTTNTTTPEWWLAQYGWTNNFDSVSTNDADGDGMPTWAEFSAGTDPTNNSSFLGFDSATPDKADNSIVIRWYSVSGKLYRLERGSNLMDNPSFGFLVRTNILGIAPMNTETDKTTTGSGPWFYRVKIE